MKEFQCHSAAHARAHEVARPSKCKMFIPSELQVVMLISVFWALSSWDRFCRSTTQQQQMSLWVPLAALSMIDALLLASHQAALIKGKPSKEAAGAAFRGGKPKQHHSTHVVRGS